jgi:hypothetical protein
VQACEHTAPMLVEKYCADENGPSVLPTLAATRQ